MEDSNIFDGLPPLSLDKDVLNRPPELLISEFGERIPGSSRTISKESPIEDLGQPKSSNEAMDAIPGSLRGGHQEQELGQNIVAVAKEVSDTDIMGELMCRAAKIRNPHAVQPRPRTKAQDTDALHISLRDVPATGSEEIPDAISHVVQRSAIGKAHIYYADNATATGVLPKAMPQINLDAASGATPKFKERTNLHVPKIYKDLLKHHLAPGFAFYANSTTNSTQKDFDFRKNFVNFGGPQSGTPVIPPMAPESKGWGEWNGMVKYFPKKQPESFTVFKYYLYKNISDSEEYPKKHWVKPPKLNKLVVDFAVYRAVAFIQILKKSKLQTEASKRKRAALSKPKQMGSRKHACQVRLPMNSQLYFLMF